MYIELSWEFATEKLWILLWFSSTEERPWAMQTLEQTPEMHCLPPYAQQFQHRAQYRALAGSFIYMWELMCFRLYPFWIAYILVYSWKLMGWKHSLAVNCDQIIYIIMLLWLFECAPASWLLWCVTEAADVAADADAKRAEVSRVPCHNVGWSCLYNFI